MIVCASDRIYKLVNNEQIKFVRQSELYIDLSHVITASAELLDKWFVLLGYMMLLVGLTMDHMANPDAALKVKAIFDVSVLLSGLVSVL